MKTDWVEIRDYYIHHPKVKDKDIAKKFNVNFRTLQNRVSKEGWQDKRKGFNTEIVKRCEEKIISQEVDKRLKAQETHLNLYDKCQKIADILLDQYLGELQSEGKTKANAYSLDAILKAISQIQKGQRLALNMDKEEGSVNEEPVIHIIEGIDIEKI